MVSGNWLSLLCELFMRTAVSDLRLHVMEIWLLAQRAPDLLLERLDPPRRAAVVMALLALVLVGLLIVACVMIGARWVRNAARHQPPRARFSKGTDLARSESPDNSSNRNSLGVNSAEMESCDTVLVNRKSTDTKADS